MVFFSVFIVLLLPLSTATLHGQLAGTSLPDAPGVASGATQQQTQSSQSGDGQTATQAQGSTSSTQNQPPPQKPEGQSQNSPAIPGEKGSRIRYGTQTAPPPSYGQQTDRILGIVPNYHSVSAGVIPPPPTVREKFRIAFENSFDYSAFLFNAINVEPSYIERSYPELGNGVPAYWGYYWRGFVDRTVGNYLDNAFIPIIARQDSRYFTLGRGHWYRRFAYSATRVLITPNDQGRNTINWSEIVGKGAAAGLGNWYYPHPEGPSWTKTGQRWLVQVGVRDAGFNVFREFWPDISTHILHMHPKPQMPSNP